MTETRKRCRAARSVLGSAVAVAVLALGTAACGSSGSPASTGSQTGGSQTGGAQTGAATTGGSQTGGATTGGSTTGGSQTGAQLFSSEGCASCHTLAAAHATGAVGPDLDQIKPSFALVVQQVENGGPSMPSFAGRMTKAQIAAVARFVSSAAGGGT